MSLAKYSDGTAKIDGRRLQKAYIRVPTDYYVECPFCAHQQDAGHDDEVMKCESCGREFFAEFSLPNAI